MKMITSYVAVDSILKMFGQPKGGSPHGSGMAVLVRSPLRVPSEFSGCYRASVYFLCCSRV
jgi:hypothetical protein